MAGVVSDAGYPIRVELDHPRQIDRWRPLVQWFLAIPHLAMLWVLGIVVQIVWVISFFAVIFLGRLPQGLFDFQAMYWRYQWRTYSYVLGLRGGYPPFDLDTTRAAPDPAILEADNAEHLNRFLPLVKWLLAIPHFIVLVLLAVAAFFAAFVGGIAVLVTGEWPESIHHLLVGLHRWAYRVQAYVFFMTDEYPPFSLD